MLCVKPQHSSAGASKNKKKKEQTKTQNMHKKKKLQKRDFVHLCTITRERERREIKQHVAYCKNAVNVLCCLHAQQKKKEHNKLKKKHFPIFKKKRRKKKMQTSIKERRIAIGTIIYFIEYAQDWNEKNY